MTPKTCHECGSSELIEQGVYTHGTWIRTLTCWTCSECSTIVSVTEDVREDDPLPA
jgi:hypothetical protein